MLKKIFLLLLFILSFTSCSEKEEHIPKSDLEIKMNSIAEGYVKLVLEIGKYDPLYVDAYYGPKEWIPAEKTLPFDSTVYKELNFRTDSLFNELDLLSQYKATELETLRYRYLYKQLLAVKAKIAVLNETEFPFDLESKEFYDATDIAQNVEEFNKVLDELDKILPGKGSIENRMINFKKQFQIPVEKIEAVFNAAIKECRERTLKYIKLPAGENFKVEYVENKPWA